MVRATLTTTLVVLTAFAGCCTHDGHRRCSRTRCDQAGHCTVPACEAGLGPCVDDECLPGDCLPDGRPPGAGVPDEQPPAAPSDDAPPPPPPKSAAGDPDSEPAAVPVADNPRPAGPYGRDGKYRWLRGRLQRVHVPGGEWKIRYLPLDVQDRWGGSMVLAPDARLDDFRDGDEVYVEGEILARRPTLYLAGPLYRVDVIRSVDIAQQSDPARR